MSQPYLEEESPDNIPRGASLSQGAGSYRWVICGLLFFATTVNYMDRQVISYLKEFFCRRRTRAASAGPTPILPTSPPSSPAFYASDDHVSPAGSSTKSAPRSASRCRSSSGPSSASPTPLWAGLVTIHILVRSAFAVGEAGNFPASIKTVAEWFPKRERALATGIFNSGSNFGAMCRRAVRPLVHDPLRRPAGMENGVHPHWRRGFSCG